MCAAPPDENDLGHSCPDRELFVLKKQGSNYDLVFMNDSFSP